MVHERVEDKVDVSVHDRMNDGMDDMAHEKVCEGPKARISLLLYIGLVRSELDLNDAKVTWVRSEESKSMDIRA